MAIYKRPNLSPNQAEFLQKLLADYVEQLLVADPEFDLAYQTYVKVRDAKEFSTKKKD